MLNLTGEHMQISLDRKSDYSLIKLGGVLIESLETDEFDKIINKLINENEKNLIVDLEEVYYANSTGLSVLFGAYRKLDKVGGTIKLINLNKKFKKLLSITKFDTLFKIYDDLDTAVQSLPE
jgi:anti-anti-sigma factor